MDSERSGPVSWSSSSIAGKWVSALGNSLRLIGSGWSAGLAPSLAAAGPGEEGTPRLGQDGWRARVSERLGSSPDSEAPPAGVGAARAA